MLDDIQTRQYFDFFTPNFHPSRFVFALGFLQEHALPDQCLLDVGCGDGSTLALIKDQTPIRKLAGLDVAESYLTKAAEATGCQQIRGSILDPELIALHAGQFDYAVIGAVLHHLLGKTRTGSRTAAQQCIRNAMALLKPGGHLIVFEPTFKPRLIMWAAFWIKSILGVFVRGRLELGASWANFAQPIVSYYSESELRSMIEMQPSKILEWRIVDQARLFGIIELRRIGAIVKKA